MSKSLPIRRLWGGTLNLFLAGDLLAAVFLPLWLAGSEEGITGGDAAQMICACLLLFLLTLLLRLAVLGVGRLLDRRVLGTVDAHALTWGGRRVPFSEIRSLGYRYAPFARLFRRPPSGVWVQLAEETLTLPHAPYWVRLALANRCPEARKKPTTAAWLMLAAAVAVGIGMTIWVGV